MTQHDLFSPAEGLSRRDHQMTSKTAALDVYPRSGTQRKRVLLCIYESGELGVTRDDVSEQLAMSPNTVRPRIKELIDAGFVEASGALRVTPWGRAAEVLVVTSKARACILSDKTSA